MCNHAKAILVVLLFVRLAGGQCHGNGGLAILEQGVQALGSLDTTTLRGGPGEAFVLFLSDGLSPVALPGIGPVCIDLASPALWLYASGTLPAAGAVSFTTSIPSTPAWESAVFFAQGAVTDPLHASGVAVSGAIRKDYEQPDTWLPVSQMPFGAGLAALATIQEWNLVFVSGGVSGPQQVSNATAAYAPLTRGFVPGPPMSGTRANHTATTLNDGRVLVAGGCFGFNGTATASCEIFDPATWSMQPAVPMGTARSRHLAVSLDDGRVLVIGGTSLDFVPLGGIGADPNAPYNNTLASAEIYDPTTGTWTPAGNLMTNGRIGHAAAKLQNGSILVAGGFEGTLPFIFLPNPLAIATCDVFDPTTGLFSPAPALPYPRAESAATTLGNGQVLVCGGKTNDPTTTLVGPTADTVLFTGNAWSQGPPLPQPMGGIHQFPLSGSRVWIGARDTAGAAVVDVAAGTASNAAGLHGAQSGFMIAQTAEGQILRCGGMFFGQGLDTASIYTPTP